MTEGGARLADAHGGAGNGQGAWPAGREARVKLAVVIAASAAGIVAAALLYRQQADLYGQALPVALLRQVVYESPVQPIYLLVALAPVYYAAARNVSWTALISGGLITFSIVLPYARFEVVDVQRGVMESAHNSLFQLAGPGHRMPQFVSILTLMLMGGLSAMYWRERVGGLIGIMGAIVILFVWPAVYDDPPPLGGDSAVVFPGKTLLFGYYVAWLGAVAGVLGPWSGPGSVREWLAARGIGTSAAKGGTSPGPPAGGRGGAL